MQLDLKTEEFREMAEMLFSDKIERLEKELEECRNGVLANTLRNNPYMRDNISKWAVLGAREAVLKLRDALCESLRAGAAT